MAQPLGQFQDEEELDEELNRLMLQEDEDMDEDKMETDKIEEEIKRLEELEKQNERGKETGRGQMEKTSPKVLLEEEVQQDEISKLRELLS